MAAHILEIDSPAGPATNGAHDASSADNSPISSRISSDSPTVTPTMDFQHGTSAGDSRNGDSPTASLSSRSFRRFSDVDMMDEDVDIKPEVSSLEPMSPTMSTAIVSRRPRGRPRKHPKPEPISISKKPMGRSKTGCITCRRRKKKCDERKPTCM
jgi:Fungal Zn(2)-Cys(6) binuclear cluster domain